MYQPEIPRFIASTSILRGADPRSLLRRNWSFAESSQENETVVKLPQGSKILGPPHAAEGKSPFGFFKVDVDTQGTVVKVKTTVAITKSRIPAAEYAAFRAFCEQVDRELGQSITFTVGK